MNPIIIYVGIGALVAATIYVAFHLGQVKTWVDNADKIAKAHADALATAAAAHAASLDAAVQASLDRLTASADHAITNVQNAQADAAKALSDLTAKA